MQATYCPQRQRPTRRRISVDVACVGPVRQEDMPQRGARLLTVLDVLTAQRREENQLN